MYIVLVSMYVLVYLCTIIYYSSLAKIRPPFLDCTSRNERGMGVYTRITQLYLKIGPLRKLHKMKAMHSTSALWQYGQAVGHLPLEIATMCWYFNFFAEETAG